MAVEIINYQTRKQGGHGHDDFREIYFPNREYGPRLFILHVPTGKLHEYQARDPVTCNNRCVGVLVKDEGLRKLVLGDERQF